MNEPSVLEGFVVVTHAQRRLLLDADLNLLKT